MVVTPKDALQRAQPLPSEDDMAVDGVTVEEWEAFEQALLISDASGVRCRRHDWESTWPSSRCRFQVSHLVVH